MFLLETHAETWLTSKDLNENWLSSKCFLFYDIKRVAWGLRILVLRRRVNTNKDKWHAVECVCVCVCVSSVVLHLVTRFSMTLLIRLSATDRPHSTHTHTHAAWLRGYHIVKTGNTLGAVATYGEQWDRHAAHHHRQQLLHLLRSCCVFSQVSRPHHFFSVFLFLTLFNSLHFSLSLHLQSLRLSLTV